MKKPLGVFLGTALLLAGALACGDDSSSDEGWGCDKIADTNACVQFAGSQYSSDQRPTYEMQCTDDEGTVVAACPSANLIGRCVQFSGTPAETILNYYTDANIETAEQVCTTVGNGTWSTP